MDKYALLIWHDCSVAVFNKFLKNEINNFLFYICNIENILMKMPSLILLENNTFNVHVKALRAIALKGPSMLSSTEIIF